MKKIQDWYKDYQAKILWSDYYQPVQKEFTKALAKYKEKKITVWGADYKGMAFLEMMDPNRKYIQKVIDIDKKRTGQMISGREIISCYGIENYHFDVIIILNQRHFVQNYTIIKDQNIDCIFHDMDEIVKKKLNCEQILRMEDMKDDTAKNEQLTKEIQKELLPLLSEVKRVCEKNKIPYFLCAGSVLGAVRHKGFIPWDDDIDIGMVRKDYERFLKIADKELSNGYLLMYGERSPNYYTCHARVFRDHTALVIGVNRHLKMHHGFYLDIFPFDTLPEGEEAQNAFYWEEKEIANEYTKMKKKKRYDGHNPIKNLIANSEYYKRNLHSSKKIFERVNDVMCRYNTEHPKYIADLCAPYNKKLFFKYEDIFPTVDMEFEGEMYPIPGNYDTYLTTMYGDYMTLPPKEKRYVKHDIVEMSTTHNYAEDDKWLKKYYRKYGRN